MTQTREELLELAREADCMHVNLLGDLAKGLERLERFAALLSARQAKQEPADGAAATRDHDESKGAQ